jgi:hypothetical protein
MRPPASHTLDPAATAPFSSRLSFAGRQLRGGPPHHLGPNRPSDRYPSAQVVIAMTDRFTRPPVALRRLPTQLHTARSSRIIDPDALGRPQP